MSQHVAQVPIETLIDSARQMAGRAYCPYSKFPVGAAILTKSGKIYAGCKVENAAFGSTLSAEKGAIVKMVAGTDPEERQIEAVAIYAPRRTSDEPDYEPSLHIIKEFGATKEHLHIESPFVPELREPPTLPSRDQIVIDDGRLTELASQARRICKRAYCRYSDFPVGAALLANSGGIYAGCNVENKKFDDTVCAERSAILQMVAGGDREISAVFIYTPTQIASAPCGSCRQVINEFGPEARIVSVCDTDDRIDATLNELLPGAFGPRNLQ